MTGTVKKHKKIVLGCLVLGFFCLFAFVATPQVFKNNSPVISKFFGNQPPMGQGSVTKYMFTVYKLALWAENNQYKYSNKLALQAWQEIEVTQEDLIKETLKKIYDNNHVSDEKLGQYEGYLKKIYPANIKPKQTWTVIYIPNKSIDFYFNGKPYGKVKDMDFAKKYFGIWMNPAGEFKDLRQNLLKNQRT
tara:strand:+ start:3698 stop:4270 length:573 start_codon:yes stop_codon:yes gene_type:complete